MIRVGSKWSTTDSMVFRVIDIVQIEGYTWIHYISEKTGKEFSCYQESFQSRFTEILE